MAYGVLPARMAPRVGHLQQTLIQRCSNNKKINNNSDNNNSNINKTNIKCMNDKHDSKNYININKSSNDKKTISSNDTNINVNNINRNNTIISTAKRTTVYIMTAMIKIISKIRIGATGNFGSGLI